MLDGMTIYWLGGSPCCGKSTISEMLVAEFGFHLYKCDDHLDRYADIGVGNGSAFMKKVKSMSLDETWLRDVDEQVEDEFVFYREALKTIEADLEKEYRGKTVVVEGAAILPEFIRNSGLDPVHYICMVPSKEFQVAQYSKREWVGHYLQGCSDPGKAFENWMERDAKYAEIVKKAAKSCGMQVITVDGSRTIEENYLLVKQMLGLSNP